MTDAKHEAPAEGAGEREALAAIMHRNMIPDEDGGFSFHDLKAADQIMDYLRARSSAPEAREGEAVAWKFRNLDLRQVGVTMDRREADRKAEAGWEIEPLGLIVQPAAPSADKLRIAVEALESAREDLLRFACARGSEWEGSLEELTEEVDQALTALNAEG